MYIPCTLYTSMYILCTPPCTFYVQLHVHSMYSMYILCTAPCTFYVQLHVHSILHLSFVLLCTFPGKVLVDTFVYRRAKCRAQYASGTACGDALTTPRPEVLRPVLVGLSIAAALSRRRGRKCRAQYASGSACDDAFAMPQPDVPMFPSPHIAVSYPVRVAHDRRVSATLRRARLWALP